MRHLFADGSRLETCFQCDYPGYTGGLVIGGYGGSGMAFIPREPLRGFESINVLCALDESIWDRDRSVEYSYGWSENFGAGADGERLEFVRGAVLEPGPDRLVLGSVNAGGCYEVEKVATTRADAAWWIFATRVTNRCPRPVHFDFFTGDDPWLGRYASSDGDVGWSPDGLLERDAELVPFTEGGIYDLGNRSLGQTPGPFSNQANFFALDPGAPLPDRAFVANRFAHARAEIDPSRVLTNQQMIALNLGWASRTLAPGASFAVALAMGLARTSEPGETPRAPAITDEDWSVWRRYLIEPGAPFAVTFAAEEVTLTLAPGTLEVEGVYHLHNPGDAHAAVAIEYPILSGAEQPAPEVVTIDGSAVPVVQGSEGPAARLSVSIAPRALSRFTVRYAQKLTARRASYRVTSARSWPAPITRALFEVRRPASFPPLSISLPVARQLRRGDLLVDRVVQRDFRPESEFVIEW